MWWYVLLDSLHIYTAQELSYAVHIRFFSYIYNCICMRRVSYTEHTVYNYGQCTHIHTHALTHTHTHRVHTHTHKHTHTHTHTHTEYRHGNGRQLYTLIPHILGVVPAVLALPLGRLSQHHCRPAHQPCS